MSFCFPLSQQTFQRSRKVIIVDLDIFFHERAAFEANTLIVSKYWGELSSSSSSSLSSSDSMSLLQDKNPPQPSLLISILYLSFPGYSSKTSYHISPSSSLSVLLSFTIPGLPFCYSVHLLSVRRMTWSVHVFFFILIDVKMSSTLGCSLIHDVPSLHVYQTFSPFPFWYLEVFIP